MRTIRRFIMLPASEEHMKVRNDSLEDGFTIDYSLELLGWDI